MTRDSDGERSQKTVAELLAEHGGQVGDAPRRRRRRAADDEPSITDTAPQAIIDRVRSEDTPASANGTGYSRRAQGTGGYPIPQATQTTEAGGRPPAQPPQNGAVTNGAAPNGAAPNGSAPGSIRANGRPAQTRRVPPVPPPPAEATPPAQAPQPSPPEPDGSFSARLDGGETAAPERPEPTPQQPSGGHPVPPPPPARRRWPRRAVPAPTPEPNTEEFPALNPPPSQHGPAADEPPAGLAGWRRRRRDQQLEDTQVGVEPVAPANAEAPAAQQGQLPQAPVEPADEGPPTGFFTPDFDDEDDDAREQGGQQPAMLEGDQQYGYEPYGDQYYDDGYDAYADGYDDAYADGYEDGETYDDYDYDYADDAQYPDEDEDQPEPAAAAAEPLDEDEPSPAKQWLALAGQLALGVAGGAAVWLGFNWLWGQLPAAALIAALVVTVALVWIVRKVRRADDLQTTVLALLVGLVVTVSPAALLLVSR